MLSTPNYEDFQTGRESEQDAQLLVRFFYKTAEDKALTASEGRPMFKEVEYCEIRIRGNRDAQACRPATFADKKRFPRHYEAFQKRVELPEEGTPLSEWPQISRSQIEELSFSSIKTVEHLSLASDTVLGRMHGGLSLKQRAATWLKASNATALIADNEAQKAKIKELEEKVEKLLHAMDSAVVEPTQIEPSKLDESTITAEDIEEIAIVEAVETPKPASRSPRRARK